MKNRFAMLAASLIALIGLGTACAAEQADADKIEDSVETTEAPATTAPRTPKTTEAPTTTVAPTTTAPPVTAPPETPGQRNARDSASSYLDFASFSHSGLIEQLEFEGFSTEDATYGVDAQNADWNEQAAKSAASYLDFTSFSHSGLVDQLEYEGFTPEQAEYGVSTTGL